jgi:hypothetical protein
MTPCSQPGAPAPAAWTRRLTLLAWAILALGAFLRLARYAAGLSLWQDEAALALNIAGRSFRGLLQPLDYDQASPIGFLLVQKACALLPGPHEYTLRLPALLGALASLPLFFWLARRCLSPRGALLALALFAVLDPLLHYAAEVKQYGLDAAAAIAATWAALAAIQEGAGPRARRGVWVLALVGVLGVWFSQSLIFVLAGLGLVLAWQCWRGPRSAGVLGASAALALSATSFAAAYLLFYRTQASNPAFAQSWADGFMPLPPRSLSNCLWLPRQALGFFADPMGLRGWILPLGLTVLGACVLWRSYRPTLALLLCPVLLALTASALHLFPVLTDSQYLYPLNGRILLFLVPALVLLLAAGLEVLWAAGQAAAAHGAVPPAAGRCLGLLFALLLIGPPAALAAAHVLRPPAVQDTRPMLAYVAAHLQPGDTLYVTWGGDYPYRYYSQRFPVLAESHVIVGGNHRHDWSGYAAEVASLRGHGRVWLVFIYTDLWKLIDEERLFRHLFDSDGRALGPEYHGANAWACLYEMAPMPPATLIDRKP